MVQTNEYKNIDQYKIKSKMLSFDNYPIFQNKIVIVTYSSLIERLSNRVGLLENTRYPITLKLFCNRPFEQIFINFKGETLLCCSDWEQKSIMGNLNYENIIDVWSNKKYQHCRLELLKNIRNGICYLCDEIGLLYPEIIIKNLFLKLNPLKF